MRRGEGARGPRHEREADLHRGRRPRRAGGGARRGRGRGGRPGRARHLSRAGAAPGPHRRRDPRGVHGGRDRTRPRLRLPGRLRPPEDPDRAPGGPARDPPGVGRDDEAPPARGAPGCPRAAPLGTAAPGKRGEAHRTRRRSPPPHGLPGTRRPLPPGEDPALPLPLPPAARPRGPPPRPHAARAPARPPGGPAAGRPEDGRALSGAAPDPGRPRALRGPARREGVRGGADGGPGSHRLAGLGEPDPRLPPPAAGEEGTSPGLRGAAGRDRRRRGGRRRDDGRSDRAARGLARPPGAPPGPPARGRLRRARPRAGALRCRRPEPPA